MGEREHRGLLAHEQDGAGALLVAVSGGPAGGAVIAAGGVATGQQAVGFFVADLGANVVADVEHARHGWLLDLCASAGWSPGSYKHNG